MTDRITRKHLDRKVEYLNWLTNSPETAWTRDETGKLTGNIGNFRIDKGWHGYTLERMSNTSGGVYHPIDSIQRPAREMFSALCAFISGIEFQQREANND